DAHEVSLAGQPLACVVKTAGEPPAAILGIDHHLDPVERRPGGLVVADEAAVRDLVPVAPVLVELEVEDQAARAGYQPSLVLHAELAFRKAGDLAGELLPGGSLHSREAGLLQSTKCVPVLQPKLANADLALEGAEVRLCHDLDLNEDGRGHPVL